jgi:chemotaxis protein CheD
VRFGDVAVPGLVAMMRDLGSRLEDLTAQVFGGATRTGTGGRTPGGRNAEVARRELAGKGIPVVSEDVGGVMGRKLLFDTQTGEVAVLKVHRLRDGDWFGC